ncbi:MULTISPECIES: acyltransferase domain-containing protein [Burkholderia]|uniref:acyltransferase domain-containing protein n=1 Tax=Burkholderia TaxID=32008 RepID=UPI0005727904|nr:MULTISPECIES: acyltransferase domain-containing protein [Burkholderia]AOJ72579.1 acyl transferase [Burkholderia savannae]KVG38517.1 acyl transferase [Burkholderia sp. MSMB0265]KVG87162.1 acyl transferase [Burkholderia sp. MSMB2040]KVG94684.1 acyl transferase [Burkholderia sp. MSMB2041]KVG96511.1 acyl transferase [Burkholderia sp. MSMB2042]
MAQVAFLFPGQGAFYAGATRALSGAYPVVQRAMQAIDAVSVRRLRRPLLATVWDEHIGVEDLLQYAPDLLQLAIYATSVSYFEALRARGVRPDVLVGHSFGEVAALACAGAFSFEQGADIVCDRIDALREAAPADGRMAAVGASPDAVRAHLAACFRGAPQGRPGRVQIAVENHSSQTVVSGAREYVDEFTAYCARHNISAQILNSPYAFHHDDLENVRIEFGRRLKAYKNKALEYPVYSPILNRYYAAADDLGACLARHLVLPVRFGDGVARLKAAGIGALVECGALNALSRIAVRALGPGAIKTFSGASSVGGELGGLENVLAYFNGGSVMNDDIRASNLQLDFDEFWRNSGPGIVEKIKGELKRFFDARGLQATPAPHIVTARGAAAGFAPVASAAPAVPTAPAAPVTQATPAVAPAAPAAPVAHAAHAAPVMQAPAAPGAGAEPADAPAARVPRDRLFAELVAIYAEAMEYPVEVFTETVELEAELGIDSVKQTEIIQRISARYGLPPLPANFRAGDFKAMGQIVDFVYEHQGQAAALVTS